MTKAPLVYIIILNWKGWQDTRECLDSCLKVSYPNYRILVVDNGSTDGSDALIEKTFPAVELIRAGNNFGFTGGNNIGMRHALSMGADYVLLLNNDTIVDPEFVTELVRIAESDAAYGIVCSKIYFHDRPDVIWYAGASFYPWLGWGRHRGYGEHDRGQYDSTEPTMRATGCVLMACKELCDKIGLLSDEYFIYCEDTDWGMRARNAGYKIIYVPSSKVWHKVSRTMGAVSGKTYYYSVRNILLCIDNNAPLPLALRYARYGTVLMTMLLSLFTQGALNLNVLKHLYLGVTHYHQRKFGKLDF